MKFSTKARTLELLENIVKCSVVKPQYRFTVADWVKEKQEHLNNIQNKFNGMSLIIRSSSLDEDGDDKSNAGKFDSILNVPCNDTQKLQHAIEEVLSVLSNNSENEIFIQECLQNVHISGVVFTCDINTCAPYFTINYDDKSGKTDTVTSGQTDELKTLILFKNSPVINKEFNSLVKATKELESLFNNEFIDIEFVIDKHGQVYILQVRPLIISLEKKSAAQKIDFDTLLHKVTKKIEKFCQPSIYLSGETTYFGLMSDWNPAEIIGERPRYLALSLYKELITDKTWAYQRDNYGYRNVRSFPLLKSFMGMPYIDIRVSFNSFVPQKLDDGIAERLIDYYLLKLKETPTLHDKVEFEVVFSCAFFGLPERLKDLQNYGFNQNEIKRIEFSLIDLTNSIINPVFGLYKKDLEKIETLKKRYLTTEQSELPLIDKIYWLIEDCKRYGTLPFAGIARAAFIAVQILKSFVATEIITQEDFQEYMNSISTISKEFQDDTKNIGIGITTEEFFSKYGHLRPGTYDILSPRYDEQKKQFNIQDGLLPKTVTSEFEFSSDQIKLIDKSLIEHGFDVTSKQLLQFIKESIEGREYAKFVFTKNISQLFLHIEELGRKYGISREDLSHLDILIVTQLYSSLGGKDVVDILRENINTNKLNYEITKQINLPHLIMDPNEVYEFHLEDGAPNFITLKKINNAIIKEKDFNDISLENKIVMIKSADPGYDWIFTKNIAGLITMYGGANSHMAIRCAEIGIPAVIGCGANKFNQWLKSDNLEIDCLQKRVRVIK